MKPAIIAITLSLLVSSSPRDAVAGDVVLVPTSGGLGADMPDIATRITEAIKRVAIRSGLSPNLTTASRDDVFAVAGCNSDDDPCHQAVLRTLAADKLILLHVTPGAEATAEVEIVIASTGKTATRLVVLLNGMTVAALISELEIKAAPAFGRPAGGEAPSGPAVEVPDENKTIDGGLATGEGTPFAGPTTPPEGDRPISPYETAEPGALPETAPVAGPVDEPRGGYDFSQVSGTSWAVGGAGAGLFVTSIIFYSLASGKQGEVDRARTNTAADIERLRDLESSGKTLTNIGNTAFLLGLVGLGVGGYLIYRDAKVRPGESTEVTIAPALYDGGIGVALEVRR